MIKIKLINLIYDFLKKIYKKKRKEWKKYLLKLT